MAIKPATGQRAPRSDACSRSYPERDMGDRKAIAGGELCVLRINYK